MSAYSNFVSRIQESIHCTAVPFDTREYENTILEIVRKNGSTLDILENAVKNYNSHKSNKKKILVTSLFYKSLPRLARMYDRNEYVKHDVFRVLCNLVLFRLSSVRGETGRIRAKIGFDNFVRVSYESLCSYSCLFSQHYNLSIPRMAKS